MPSRVKSHDAIPIDPVQLGGGDFVRMRRWLTSQDRDEMNAKMVELDLVNSTGTLDIKTANRATLLQAIVSWDGPGFCVDDHQDVEGNDLEIPEGHTHTPIPVTFENISNLPDPDMQKLVTKLKTGRPNPKVGVGANT